MPYPIATATVRENAPVELTQELDCEEPVVGTAAEPVSEEDEIGSEISRHFIRLGKRDFSRTASAGTPENRPD
jgi:hypothetical protein